MMAEYDSDRKEMRCLPSFKVITKIWFYQLFGKPFDRIEIYFNRRLYLAGGSARIAGSRHPDG